MALGTWSHHAKIRHRNNVTSKSEVVGQSSIAPELGHRRHWGKFYSEPLLELTDGVRAPGGLTCEHFHVRDRRMIPVIVRSSQAKLGITSVVRSDVRTRPSLSDGKPVHGPLLRTLGFLADEG